MKKKEDKRFKSDLLKVRQRRSVIEVSEEENQSKGKEQILKTIIQKTFPEIKKL